MRGKSGQHRTRRLLTATGGDSRESATETRPPVSIGKDETSEVRAHSDAWRHAEEVNPVCCKEDFYIGLFDQGSDNRLI
jgi:hypothetical protein